VTCLPVCRTAPTGFRFSVDGVDSAQQRRQYALVDGYPADDVIMITGFKQTSRD
jgi:hypothetical protein